MKVLRFLLRMVAHRLSPPEFRTLMFIFDRTYCWRKREEKISYEHFLNGIEKGDIVYAGKVGMSDKTLKRALRGLRVKGMVIKNRTAPTAVVTYAIHPEIHEIAINDDW